MIYLFTFLFICSFGVSLSGSETTTGTPFISHFSYDTYKLSNNNSDIVQDQRGIMYFANEFGILEFDGANWEIIQVASNRSSIKSLAIDKNGRLYAGAQGDFGYLIYQEPDGLTFKSLVEKIPEEDRMFGDVWNTIVKDEQVIFHSWNGIYVYNNDTIKVYKTGSKIKGVFHVSDKIIIQDEKTFFELTAEGLTPQKRGEQFANMEIRFILPFNNKLVIGTHLNGLFLLKDNIAEPYYIKPPFNFKDSKITSGHLRRNGNLVIGTADKGVCFINQEGEMIRHLSKERGIQNNEIRHIFSDRKNNLWISNKKGIDYVQLASPFSRIIPDPEEPQGVYSAISYNDKVYFATHNGLLQASKKELSQIKSAPVKFTRIKGTPDINWHLNKIKDLIIISHSNGFSQIKDGEISSLYEKEGGWMVARLPGHKEYLIGGTYSGLILFKERNGKYEFVNEIKGFKESSRVIETDEHGNIWIAHGYKGIFKLRLNEGLTRIDSIAFYDRNKGLPSNIYNSVFKIWGSIVFGTQNGFYKYDSVNDSMVINNELTELIGKEQGRKLKEDQYGNIWFVVGNESGRIKKHADGSLTIEKTPYSKLNHYYIPGFENFHSLNKKLTLIGTKNGAILHNMDKTHTGNHDSHVLLRQVQCVENQEVIYSDRINYLCDTAIHSNYEFPFKHNSFRFSFSSGGYNNAQDIKYQYFLQGLDNNWSDWVSSPTRIYEDLREGEYIFRLKAKNIYNSVSEEATFEFKILPPIHRTKLAYLVYLILLVFAFIIFFRVRNLKLQREKERYIKEQTRLRELEQACFMKENLQNKLLDNENRLSDLNLKTIYTDEKLTELKEKVSDIIKVAPEKVSEKLYKILEFIDNELDGNNSEDFELRFDQAHNSFLKKLKTEHPQLTPKDLKICAYLKMNLSSKEIASLLNMSVRGVENARYRIRKRIQLDASVNLTEWILLRK